MACLFSQIDGVLLSYACRKESGALACLLLWRLFLPGLHGFSAEGFTDLTQGGICG